MEAWIPSVLGAPATQFWWGMAGLCGVVAFSAWRALRQLSHKRLMENTPTSLIRSAAQGYVELQGHAALLAGDPIVATLSGEQCVWFRYSVERKERSTNHRGHTQTRWRTVEHGVSEHLFALVDPTGTCVIDPDGAQVTAAVRNLWYGHSPQPPRVTAVPGWSQWLGFASLGRTYRYTEERIAIGSPLYALGLFRSHAGALPGPDPSAVSALLREWKRDQSALKQRFDTDRNGHIDSHEWDAARQAASAELRDTSKGNLPPAVDTLADPRDPQRPFLLSAATEKALTGRAQWRILSFGSIAFAGAALLVWSITIRLTSA